MSNARFSEYATSGAFSMSLSRHQVSALAMIADGAGSSWHLSDASLERKGLVEPVAKPSDHQDDRVEFRPTLAGLLCARLVREAGLSNGPDDPIAAELADLRRELEQRRHEAATNRDVAWSALARKEEAERELEEAQRELRLFRTESAGGPRLKEQFRRDPQAPPMIRRRDKFPTTSDAELRVMTEAQPS